MNVKDMKITGIELANAMALYLHVGDSAIFNVNYFDLKNGQMPGYAVLAIVKHIFDKVENVIRAYGDEPFVIEDEIVKAIETAKQKYDEDQE